MVAVNALRCPTWCTTDHAEQDRRLEADLVKLRARTGRESNYTPDWMARWHTRTVAEIHNPEDPRQPVKVTLFRDDSLVDPDANRVVISAEHADTMPPETAVRVALALAEAVRVATDGQPVGSLPTGVLVARIAAEVAAAQHLAEAAGRLLAGPAGEPPAAVGAQLNQLQAAYDRWCDKTREGDGYEYTGPNIRRAVQGCESR